MTGKIKNISLPVQLWRNDESCQKAAISTKKNGIAKKRRMIKRLHTIAECLVLIRIVILFAIAAIAASALLNVFLQEL